MPGELLFQHTTRLDEQTSIDRLVRHTHALVVRILRLQPARDLLGRPIQTQLTRDYPPQSVVAAEQTRLGTPCRVPRAAISVRSPVAIPPAMSRYLPADRRRSSSKSLRDASNRAPDGNASRDLFALHQAQCQLRSSPRSRRNPTAASGDIVNRRPISAQVVPDGAH